MSYTIKLWKASRSNRTIERILTTVDIRKRNSEKNLKEHSIREHYGDLATCEHDFKIGVLV